MGLWSRRKTGVYFPLWLALITLTAWKNAGENELCANIFCKFSNHFSIWNTLFNIVVALAAYIKNTTSPSCLSLPHSLDLILDLLSVLDLVPLLLIVAQNAVIQSDKVACHNSTALRLRRRVIHTRISPPPVWKYQLNPDMSRLYLPVLHIIWMMNFFILVNKNVLGLWSNDNNVIITISFNSYTVLRHLHHFRYETIKSVL